MTAPASFGIRLSRGVWLAALWGAFFEAAILLYRLANTPYSLERLARVTRVAELSAAAAAAGLLAGLATLRWLRRGSRVDLEGVASAAGLLFCAWLATAFLVLPPAPEAIQFTGDPISLRLPMILVATGGLAAVLLAAVRLRGSRLVAVVAVRGLLPRTLAALCLVALLLVPGTGAPRAKRAPDIFLIAVDTLRADHLGCYGYSLPTSPAIDRLCRSSIVFDQAMTLVPETVPAVTSILTGRLPQANRVFNNFQRARDELRILPEQLREAGYFTAAIFESSLIGTFSNLDQGFDLVVQRGIVARTPFYTLADAIHSLWAGANSLLNERFRLARSVTTDAAARWLGDLPSGQPLFLAVWWPYPHTTYEPPRRYLDLVPAPDAEPPFVAPIHGYDGEIRFTDDQVERFLRAITDGRDFDESWIVFTADHGEELGRTVPDLEGPVFGHSHFLYDTSLRVPLIVHPPAASGLPARRERSIVTSAALAATLLRAAGLEESPELEAPLALDSHSEKATLTFSIMRRNWPTLYGEPLDRVSVRSDEWRLIETRRPRYGLELLRYREGGELPVPIAERPDVVAELLEALHAQYPPGDSQGDGESPELSDAAKEQLRSLGYLP